MKIFVISMKSYKARREFQIRQAKSLNLDISFIDAINGSDLSSEELQNAANEWTRPIFSKDVGCYLSHRKVWQEVCKEEQKCLVVEDDVIFSSKIKQILNSIENLKDSWNSVYDLEFAPGDHVLSNKVSFSDEKNLFEIKEIYQNKTGLAAYVLGPQLASKMLSELNNYVMIDAAFWSRKWPKYLQIEPAPVVQMMHIGKAIKSDDSSIEDVRNINYLNKSWLSRKAIRLKISLLEFPKFIKGTLLGDKRTLKFDKDEFIKNFDNLYD